MHWLSVRMVICWSASFNESSTLILCHILQIVSHWLVLDHLINESSTRRTVEGVAHACFSDEAQCLELPQASYVEWHRAGCCSCSPALFVSAASHTFGAALLLRSDLSTSTGGSSSSSG